jgi:hypothetical protein
MTQVMPETHAIPNILTHLRFWHNQRHITNTTLVKPGASDKETVSTGRGNKVLCTNADRLVGLITLTNPFTISADTINMQFNFNITNYGVQFFNEDAYTVPNDVGSGPFSGSFVIINK